MKPLGILGILLIVVGVAGLAIDNISFTERKTIIDAKTVAVQLLPPEPTTALYEAPLSLTIDGKPGVGWVEFMWPMAQVERAKALAAA